MTITNSVFTLLNCCLCMLIKFIYTSICFSNSTIRQQLTNTEDIRRLRKKAPCSRSEISMLEKQFWEDDIFSEPIFTGELFLDQFIFS